MGVTWLIFFQESKIYPYPTNFMKKKKSLILSLNSCNRHPASLFWKIIIKLLGKVKIYLFSQDVTRYWTIYFGISSKIGIRFLDSIVN